MIMHRADPAAVIRALRSAAPYIRLYKGKTFVVKVGGGVFGDPGATRALVEQIAVLHSLGVRVVFVHGGGSQLTELTEKLGVPTRMIEGRRVTDAESVDATAMVLSGLINTRILAACRELNLPAVGISGVDAGLIQAHKRAPVKMQGSDETVDYGFVGDIDHVDTDVLRKLLDNGLMPVISPLSSDDAGTLLNINADTVAAAIGAALGAEKLVLCTGAPGILADINDPTSVVSYTDLAGLAKPSRTPSRAACSACMSSPTRRPMLSSPKCSPTKVRGRSWSQTSASSHRQSSRQATPNREPPLGQRRTAR